MEQPLTSGPDARRRLKIGFARLLQEIGWAGLAGLVSCMAAALVARTASELRAVGAMQALEVPARGPALPPLAQLEPRQSKVRLASQAETDLLLARIERAATGNGLAWSAADYRIVPATDREPAVLEVRCSFRAPYAPLRSMISDLIGTLPAMTFREMSFSRADVGSADVDAKFAIAVFLEDDGSASKSAR